LKLHAEEVSLAWAPATGWNLHGRAGNSFRVGNIDENRCRFSNPIQCGGTQALSLLAPQLSRDLESGVAYRSRSVDVDLRVFEHRLRSEIMFTSFFGFQNINLPPTRRDGIELHGKWRPTAGLSFNAFYTHVRARFESGTLGGVDLTGKEVQLVPSDRANINAVWRPRDADAASIGIQYVGSQVHENDQQNACRRIPAYATIEGKYTRTIGNVALSVGGSNLGNKGFYAYGVCGTAGALAIYPERPRMIYLSAALRF
jgi:iron complex outermembrane receptor protein